MVKFIVEMGELSWRLLFPFTMPIFWTMRSFFNGILKLKTGLNDPFFIAFITIIGDILSGGIVEVYMTLCCNRNSDEDEQRIKANKLKDERITLVLGHHNSHQKIKPKESTFIPYVLIGLNSLIECAFLTIFTILGNNASAALICFQMNIVLILIESLSTYFILQYRIYTHQIVSIIILIIGIIAIFIDGALKGIDLMVYFYYLIIYSFISILDVSQKWLMNKKYYTSTRLLLLQGLGSVIIFLIVFAILPWIHCNQSHYEFCSSKEYVENVFDTVIQYFNESNWGMNLLCLFVYMIACSLYVLFVFITIDLYTPTHRCMSDTLGVIVFWVVSLIMKEIRFEWFALGWYALIWVSCLIYNDVIILMFCGLEVNTKKYIMLRSKEDYCHADSNNVQMKENEISLLPIGLQKMERLDDSDHSSNSNSNTDI